MPFTVPLSAFSPTCLYHLCQEAGGERTTRDPQWKEKHPTQPTNCSNLTPRIPEYLHEIPSCKSQSFGIYFTVHEIETPTVYQDARLSRCVSACQLANLPTCRPVNPSTSQPVGPPTCRLLSRQLACIVTCVVLMRCSCQSLDTGKALMPQRFDAVSTVKIPRHSLPCIRAPFPPSQPFPAISSASSEASWARLAVTALLPRATFPPSCPCYDPSGSSV